MNTQIFITATVLAVVLVVGIVSTTAPVFADNNSVKQSNKANIHIKNSGSGDATGAVSQNNNGCSGDFASC